MSDGLRDRRGRNKSPIFNGLGSLLHDYCTRTAPQVNFGTTSQAVPKRGDFAPIWGAETLFQRLILLVPPDATRPSQLSFWTGFLTLGESMPWRRQSESVL